MTLLGLMNWSANVFLPLYGVLQVVMALLHYGGVGSGFIPALRGRGTFLLAMGVLQSFGSAADRGILRCPRNGRSQLGGADGN